MRRQNAPLLFRVLSAQVLITSCIHCELSNLFKNAMYPRFPRLLQYAYLKMADGHVALWSINLSYAFPWWTNGAWALETVETKSMKGTISYNVTWWNPGTIHTMWGSSERNHIWSVSFFPHTGREVGITWFNCAGCCEFTQSKFFVHGILKMDGFESPSRCFSLPTLHCND